MSDNEYCCGANPCHHGACVQANADRKYIEAMQLAFADPDNGVLLTHDAFTRLCNAALAAQPAATPAAPLTCDGCGKPVRPPYCSCGDPKPALHAGNWASMNWCRKCGHALPIADKKGQS